MKPSKDKKFDLDKYDTEERRVKLSQDFSYVETWMSQHGDSALTLATHIKQSGSPRRSVAESEALTTAFNHVIDFCNTALSAPLECPKRVDQRLRTAIRRVQGFSVTVTDPLDCQHEHTLKDFIR